MTIRFSKISATYDDEPIKSHTDNYLLSNLNN